MDDGVESALLPEAQGRLTVNSAHNMAACDTEAARELNEPRLGAVPSARCARHRRPCEDRSRLEQDVR